MDIQRFDHGHNHTPDEPFSVHELREVGDDTASIAERLQEVMPILDGINADLTSLVADAQAAADRVTADLAAKSAAVDAATAQVADLQSQVDALTAGAVAQSDIDALSALVAQVAAAVAAIDAPPAP